MSNYTFVVSEKSFSGERIDKFLSTCILLDKPELTRNAIVRLIKEKCCFVNGKEVKKNYKVQFGDKIKLELKPSVETNIIAEEIPLDIFYEDNDLLVVNKPRGMVVHPAHGHHGKTLVNALMFHCKDSLSGINGELRPGIVHRIDKDTSGLLLVAKNDFTHTNLAEQLKEHSVVRQYEAVVHGRIKENGTINAPIARHKTDRKKMCVSDSGVSKNAVTHYKIIKHYSNATHVRLTLETGRTHQIRVHMAYMGHPVMGDFVYGSGKPDWLCGQCLDAKKIGFIHPRNKEYMEFEKDLPDYFLKLLKSLK